MSDSPLMVKSKELALAVIHVCKALRNSKCEGALISQFLRSGTSVGANIREAQYAHGRPDFIAKLQIALKECSETEYWIELLRETDYITEEQFESLKNDYKELIKILTAITKTTDPKIGG